MTQKLTLTLWNLLEESPKGKQYLSSKMFHVVYSHTCTHLHTLHLIILRSYLVAMYYKLYREQLSLVQTQDPEAK